MYSLNGAWSFLIMISTSCKLQSILAPVHEVSKDPRNSESVGGMRKKIVDDRLKPLVNFIMDDELAALIYIETRTSPKMNIA
jgi:hypothetical protein